MNTELIPAPDTIPVSWWWFQILLLFTFLIHLILMNFILGGSLLTVWDIIRGKNLGKESKSIPTLIALTINFGVPPLLFVQVLYGHFFYTSSVIMAVGWILVIPVLILAYYGAYIFTERVDKAPVWGKISLSISALILLIIAFIYVSNNTLALAPARWTEYFEQTGANFFNLGEKTLWPRYLHMVIGAVAIAGLGKAVYYKFSKKLEAHKQKEGIKSGLKIFGIFTVVEFLLGFWFWLSLPKDIWMLFMGQNIAYTIIMIISWILSLLIMHSAFTGRLLTSTIFGLLVMALMVIIRDLVRHAYLGDVFHPKDLIIAKQASPLLAFLLVFVIGLLSLYYMIKLITKPSTEQS